MVVVVIALTHIKLPQACVNPIRPALWQPPVRQGIISDWSSRPTDDRSFSKSRHSGLTMRAALPNHSRWRLSGYRDHRRNPRYAEKCMDRLRNAIEIFARYRMSLICIRPT
jgi:hypothetical protein